FREGRQIPGLLNGAGEATRRTVALDEATRRTVAAPRSVAPEQGPAVPRAKQRLGLGRLGVRAFGLILLAALLYAGYVATTTYLLWRRGDEFATAIKSEAITDPDQVWSQWTELSRENPSSFFLG